MEGVLNLNLGMMVDGNSRFAFVEILQRTGFSPSELSDESIKSVVLEAYKARLKEVYAKNADWCIDLGEALFSRVDYSDYAVFVYNAVNRKRNHFSGIDNAIRRVGGDLVKRLGAHGPVCLIGPENEKEQWFSLYPDLQELEPGSANAGNRSIIITGYQQGCGEDPHVAGMRPLDYFVRSTQMRFSGMYLPALANTQLVTLSHIPYLYPPEALVNALLNEASLDEEHDELNLYTPRVYDAWLEHYDREPSVFLSSNAFPPRVKKMGRVLGNESRALTGVQRGG